MTLPRRPLLLLLVTASLALSTAGASPGAAGYPIACKRLVQSTVGGGGEDYAWEIAVDGDGATYVVGMTDSADLPTTAGVHDATYNGNGDAYVMKIGRTGEVVFATYVGGSMLDQASAVALDPLGNIYIAGYTYSPDFPATGDAFDTSFNGSIDAFVASLSADGSTLRYATFLGGSDDDYGGAIAVDGDGHAVMTGYSESSNYPVLFGAFDATYNGGGDVVVTKVLPAGDALRYSTFVGGASFEGGYAIALDPDGNAHVSGITSSTNLPVTFGAFQKYYGGGQADAFVLKLAPGGAKLHFLTYLGSTEFEDARAIAVDGSGAVFTAGRTESPDFPTTAGSYDTGYDGGRDAFVTKLSPSGTSLAYSTFVGGNGEDETGGIAIGGWGTAYVSGWTTSSNFPTTTLACQSQGFGDYDAVLYALSAAGDALVYGSYYGEPQADYARGVAIDATGSVRIGGYATHATADVFVYRLP